MGYDEWGYNYQAQMFNGSWCDYHPYYRPGGGGYDWCLANNSNIQLSMKWNDAWLSNKDCDGDGVLDRHYGFATYQGSGAWLTNHEKGEYLDANGDICKYTYFIKMIAPPLDANKIDGVWYTADGVMIGPDIWNIFAIIQEVYNDPCGGNHGILFKSDDHLGFGGW